MPPFPKEDTARLVARYTEAAERCRAQLPIDDAPHGDFWWLLDDMVNNDSDEWAAPLAFYHQNAMDQYADAVNPEAHPVDRANSWKYAAQLFTILAAALQYEAL